MTLNRFAKILTVSKASLFVMMMFVGMMAMAQETPVAEAAAAANGGIAEACKYIAIAVIMACGSLSAASAVGKIGSAAMGSAVEKPELLGKAIAFVGLGEGIALFGFLISLFLLNK